MLFESAFGALRDPKRADLVSTCGDLSGTRALREIYGKMINDKEGRLILKEKPRLNLDSINFDSFEEYPKNSFGYHYWSFMKKYEFSPNERPKVKYIPDIELAYIMQRYKECHDMLHVLNNLDVEVESEIAVKWFEMIQTGIPMTALASLVGPLRLGFGPNQKLMFTLLPLVLRNAYRSRFFMNIYFEKYFEKDIDQFRDEIGIVPYKS